MREAPQTENDEVDVENSLEILKNLTLFSEKIGDQLQDLIHKFETSLTRDKVEKSNQVKILSYFYILYVYWFIYPDILRSLRGFLMISLFFSDLSGH